MAASDSFLVVVLITTSSNAAALAPIEPFTVVVSLDFTITSLKSKVSYPTKLNSRVYVPGCRFSIVYKPSKSVVVPWWFLLLAH